MNPLEIKGSLLPVGGTKAGEPAGDKEKSGEEKKLRKACADFESLFIFQMLKTMRTTVPESGLLNKMTGRETYEMMMDQKVSEDLAHHGGLGLQNVLFKQWDKGK